MARMLKCGRTYHLPALPAATKDDTRRADMALLEAADTLVATEKMDGENTTIHQDGCHARAPTAAIIPRGTG